ncbi:MAG: ACT domain-containing protein, partial [Tepidisphaeraceae bacterium]
MRRAAIANIRPSCPPPTNPMVFPGRITRIGVSEEQLIVDSGSSIVKQGGRRLFSHDRRLSILGMLMPQVLAVISVLGKDQKGVVAQFATFLADRGTNIEDIEQRVVSGFFVMDMLVDLADLRC